MKEDGGEQFEQVGFAAAIGTSSNEGTEFGVVFSSDLAVTGCAVLQLLFEFPLGAEMVFEAGLQTAEGFGVGEFQAKQFHERSILACGNADLIFLVLVLLF